MLSLEMMCAYSLLNDFMALDLFDKILLMTFRTYDIIFVSSISYVRKEPWDEKKNIRNG
jgi:hypothetical protein